MAEFSKPSNTNKIWAETGTAVAPSDSKIQQGWIAEIPSFENENWEQQRQDQFIAHVNQHGLPEWDSVTEYIQNKSYIMGGNGVIYRCIQTHTNKNPVSAPDATAFWREAFDAADTSYTKPESDDLYAKKTNNLSDLNNPSAARSNLQLGTAATRNVGTAVNNVMAVGAFGIGAVTGSWANTNLNTYVLTQWTTVGPSAANAPIAGRYGYLAVQSGGDVNWVKQTFEPIDGANIYTRKYQNGTWSGWTEVYTTANFNPATKFNTVGGTLTGRTVVQFNPAATAFNAGHIELYTTNGTYPQLGFHRAGFNGISLFMAEDTRLYARDHAGGQGKIWDGRDAAFQPQIQGYRNLPDGSVEQWGFFHVGDIVGTTTVNIPYHFAFSSTAFNVQAAVYGSPASNLLLYLNNVNNASFFTARVAEAAGNIDDIYIMWRVIGR